MELLLEVLADVLGTTAGELNELVSSEVGLKSKPEILKIVREKQADKIADIKRNASDEGYKKAERLIKSDLEKQIAEKFGVEKAPILDLIDSVVAKETVNAKMNSDSVRNSQTYQDDLKKWKQDLQKQKEELERLQTERQKERQETLLQRYGASLLKDKNYVLPEEETKASFQLNLLYKLILEDPDLILDEENGKPVLKNKAGEKKYDELGNPLTFDTLFSSKADLFFPVAKSDDRKSPENKGNPSGKTFTFPQVNSPDEFMAAQHKIQDPEEKAAFIKHYRENVEPTLK